MSETLNNRTIIKIAGISSFTGMLAAIPISLFLFIAGVSGQQANAAQQTNNQPANMPTAINTDYEAYAHAYTQGYLANAVVDRSVDLGEACTNTGVVQNQGSAVNVVGAQSNVPATSDKTAHKTKPKIDPKPAYEKYVKHIKHVSNSYNTTEDNSTQTVSYINSNNTVGSNNVSHSSSHTSVEVEDSAFVNVETEESEAEVNNETNYSGDTTIENTGNTTTVDVDYEETNTSDSYNTETDVDTEIDNSETTINNTETNVDHDETNINHEETNVSNEETNIDYEEENTNVVINESFNKEEEIELEV